MEMISPLKRYGHCCILECVVNKSTNLIATINLSIMCPHFQNHNSANLFKPSNFGHAGKKALSDLPPASYNIVLMLVWHCAHCLLLLHSF